MTNRKDCISFNLSFCSKYICSLKLWDCLDRKGKQETALRYLDASSESHTKQFEGKTFRGQDYLNLYVFLRLQHSLLSHILVSWLSLAVKKSEKLGIYILKCVLKSFQKLSDITKQRFTTRGVFSLEKLHKSWYF